MSDFITAFARQQLRDMEQVQRDFGRRRPQRHRHRGARALTALQTPRLVAVALAHRLRSLDLGRRPRTPLAATPLPLRLTPHGRHRAT